MERQAIGYKLEWGVALVMLAIISGIALIAGGVLFWLFVLGGAIGGAIAGGIIGAGAALISMAVYVKRAPAVLVHMDAQAVYLHKKSVTIYGILNVQAKGNSIVITPKSGKKLQQGFLRNSVECARHIMTVIQTGKHNKPDYND